jgi:FAD:protein FMN transferase
VSHVSAARAPVRDSASEIFIRRARPLMGTLVGVAVRGDDAAALERLVRGIFDEMKRLESILSEWSPTSDVSRVNDAAGTVPTIVPAELIEVLETADRVARATGGAFDPTWAALAPIWRMEAPGFRPPAPRIVEATRQLVDYRDVIVDAPNRTVLLRRPGMRLGLGGIAKAYVAERAADFAVANGASAVLIDAGGDLVARGRNGERPWIVGVRDHRSPAALIAAVEVHDEAIATSGDYEHCVEIGGRRYHHLLDPRSGWPAVQSRSATVIAPSGALADALATALFVIGASGLDIALPFSGAAAMVVRENGTSFISAGAADRFKSIESWR